MTTERSNIDNGHYVVEARHSKYRDVVEVIGKNVRFGCHHQNIDIFLGSYGFVRKINLED